MFRTAIIASGFLAWATMSTAIAQLPGSSDLTRAIFSAIPADEEFPNSVQRRNFAEAIEAYWEYFDDKVPRLSPREIEWVESELSRPPESLTRLLNSKEYAIWQLNNQTDTCLGNIRKVLESYSSEQARQTEMFYWLKMINCYQGDTISYLRQAAIPHNDSNGQHVQVLNAESVLQGIIVNKVAAAAMAETMGWTLSAE